MKRKDNKKTDFREIVHSFAFKYLKIVGGREDSFTVEKCKKLIDHTVPIG